MTAEEDIKLFLPKYLSTESERELFETLKKDFPENVNKKFFCEVLKESEIVYQGDGIREVEIPNESITANCLVVSNSCDISPENFRLYKSHILLSPILNLESYRKKLLKEYPEKVPEISSHIDDLKKQKISRMFYIPNYSGIGESFVKFDLMFNRLIDEKFYKELIKKRLFILGNTSFFLFLFKISINFTRVFEKVDRKTS